MTSPKDLIKNLLASVDTSPLKEEVTSSIRLDRLICTVLAEGYLPPPSIIVLRSDSHTDPSTAAAVRHTLDHSTLVYHTLASILLLENTITLSTMQQALKLRATNLCGGYPQPARTIVESFIQDLQTSLETCRQILPKVSFQ